MKFLVWKNSYSFKNFFDFTFNENSSIRIWISAHACVWSAIMIFILSLWIAFSFSGQLKINRIEIIKWNWSLSIFSESRKNQNTIEKNEFYEWKIWRTIMKTMNENSFICIKINSWFNTIRFRQHFFLSIDFFLSSFQQLVSLWSDLIKRNFVSTSFYHRFHTGQISTADFFEIKRSFRQHSFLSSIYTDQHLIS